MAQGWSCVLIGYSEQNDGRARPTDEWKKGRWLVNPSVGVVTTNQVEALSRQIAREFDPDKIILFGSHAYGTPAEYSDVDLLVILPFTGSGFDKSLEILGRVDPRFAIDLIVRRPDDTERRYREFDPLIRDALDRGRILYERKR